MELAPHNARWHWPALFVSLAVVAAVAIVGSQASVSSPEYYRELVRPSWAPPAWVFAPVWTVLYLMMAVAAWLVWRSQPRPSSAMVWYGVQLVLNGLWTWIFFYWRRPDLALAEILLLWAAIAMTIRAFQRIERRAARLLLPYLAWVTFATALTAAIWRSN
jgi:tryptophan-rich sensory protein